MSTASLVFVELTEGGHRSSLLRHLTVYAGRHVSEMSILTTQAVVDRAGFSGIDAEFVVVPGLDLTAKTDSTAAAIRQQLDIFKRVSRALSRGNPDTVAVFPTLQQTGLIPAGLSRSGFPVPWVGVVMAPAPHLDVYAIKTHHSKFEKKIQAVAYHRLKNFSKCIKINSFDPLFANWMADSKVQYCPDPALAPISSSDPPQALGFVERIQHPKLLVCGTLDKRKRIEFLAKILMQIEECTPFHLILAGKTHENIKEQLSSESVEALRRQGRLSLINRRLDDVELSYLLGSAEVVWSGNFRRYGSSGTVVSAGVHGKPVLTTSGSVIGSMCSEHGGGPVIDLNSEEEVVRELTKLTSKRYREQLGVANKALFSNNTVENYTRTILDPIIGGKFNV